MCKKMQILSQVLMGRSEYSLCRTLFKANCIGTSRQLLSLVMTYQDLGKGFFHTPRPFASN